MLNRITATLAGAAAVALSATAAFAQATTIPGEQVGLAAGAPLPEGLYAVDTFIYRRTDQPFSPDTAINVPFLLWSTPLTPFGGRIEALVAQPTVFAFTRNGAGQRNKDISINVGTLLAGIWAFDLGNNFGVSFLGGVHLNDLDAGRGSLGTGLSGTPVLPQLSSNTYRFGVAGSYTGDGWNITANLTGNVYDTPGRFGGPIGAAIGPIRLSDAILLDLTATKKFGNFEIGPVAYGVYNFDTSQFSAANGNRGRFAVGGLIGYDFKAFTVQAYVARDVVTGAQYTNALGRTRDNYSTDGFVRFVVPLYTPPAPAAVVAPLVRKG
ncbi:transporter [Methylobacterium mesophilicum]